MIERLTTIRADPQVPAGTSAFRFGNSTLFFVKEEIYALEYNNRVVVRGDLNIGPQERRRLNLWREFEKQELVEYYEFIVLLQDALLYGMKEVRDEIFAGA